MLNEFHSLINNNNFDAIQKQLNNVALKKIDHQ